MKLHFYDVRSLKTAWAFFDFEFYFLTFIKGLEPVLLDSGEVYEYIVAIFALDETESFFCVKPFYFTLFHVCFLLGAVRHTCVTILAQVLMCQDEENSTRTSLPNKNNSLTS